MEMMKFNSVEEFANFAETAPKKETTNPETMNSSRNGSKDFTNTLDFQQALNFARLGWKEGRDKIKSRLGLEYAPKRKERIHDVCGDFPDIGRFIAGQPKSMTRRALTSAKRKPIISITMNASYSYFVSKSSIENYGLAMTQVIDELENQGYSLDVFIGLGVKPNGSEKNNPRGFIVHVKKAGEPLELDKFIFCSSNVSFLRRLGLAIYENFWTYNEIGFGYGSPREITPEKNSIYFGNASDFVSAYCFTLESAVAAVKEKILEIMPDISFNEFKAA